MRFEIDTNLIACSKSNRIVTVMNADIILAPLIIGLKTIDLISAGGDGYF